MLAAELVHVLDRAFVHQVSQGILSVVQGLQVHGTHLLPVTGAVGLMIGVVLQLDHHFLAVELDALQGQGSVAVFAPVLFLVVHAVEQLEGKVVLGFGHADDAAVGHRKAGVPLAGRVVVHLDVVHHARLLVAALYAQDIPVDAVVEGSRGDFDLTLGAADVVSHGVDLVDGVGDQAVSHVESPHADQQGDDGHGYQHAGQGDAGGLHGRELEFLSHVSQRHHGAEQRSQRNGHGQRLAASPHEEFQDYLEFQALTYQFVNVQPKELHDQDECDNRQDRDERSYERFQQKLV